MQQIHTEKDGFDCVRDFCAKHQVPGVGCKFKAQIHKIEMTHQDARGPSFARYMQQSLINNEDFCLQVDSHTDFISGWDEEVTSMWHEAGNEYAILSTVLPDISALHHSQIDNKGVPRVCQAKVNARYINVIVSFA